MGISLAYLFYFLYLGLSISLVAGVGHRIHKDGLVFLQELFPDQGNLAERINDLMLLGWYLLNIGYCVIFMKLCRHPETTLMLVRELSFKIGSITLLLGFIHYFNVLAFLNWRKGSQNHTL